MGWFRRAHRKWQGLPLELKVSAFIAPLVVFAITFAVEQLYAGGRQPEAAAQAEVEDVRSREAAPSAEPHATSELEVVDVRVETPPDGPPVVDVLVRNVGNTVAVITGVRFVARDSLLGTPRREISALSSQEALPPSGTYDAAAEEQLAEEAPVSASGRPDSIPTGEEVSFTVAQQVRAGEADRFTVTLPETRQGDGMALVLLDGVLAYDRAGTTADLGPVLVAGPLPSGDLAFPRDALDRFEDHLAGASTSRELEDLIEAALDRTTLE